MSRIDYPVRMAILDMNNNHENMGIASIKRIADRFAIVDYEVFDVRHKLEVPGLDFDIYISSGGPGDPLEYEGGWEKEYYSLMDRLWEHNATKEDKKFVFFICHSFQMICHHLQVAKVMAREKESFGIVPIDKTEAGNNESLFTGLNNPFYGADFRKHEVIYPDSKKIKELGSVVTALEKTKPEHPGEKGLMAIRFSKEWFGTQFHPEAHPDGMFLYLRRREKKEMILKTFGMNTYEEMIHNAIHPARLTVTRDHILPGFIRDAIDQILEYSDSQPLVVNG